jgi:hypothetical protein
VALGGDPEKVNPLQPVELVIDHSVQVDHFGTAQRSGLECRSRISSATVSGTCSCVGDKRPSAISASCPPRPASSIR